MNKKLAKKYGTLYVPNVLAGLLGNASLMYDAIHPNEEGYKIIANRVTPVLEKIFK